MQKPRIPPHPTTKQEILFLRRMGFPAQKKMKVQISDDLSLVFCLESVLLESLQTRLYFVFPVVLSTEKH